MMDIRKLTQCHADDDIPPPDPPEPINRPGGFKKTRGS